MAQYDVGNNTAINKAPLWGTFASFLSSNLSRPNAIVVPDNSTANEGVAYNHRLFQGIPKYLSYAFYVSLFFFGVSGNMIVLYVVGYRKKKRKGMDLHIISLACADFLSSVSIPMVMLNDLITGYSGWLYSEAMCYILPPICVATHTVSSWSLVLISLDRYRIILKPMFPRPRKSILYRSMAWFWLSSVGISVPYAMRLKLNDGMCLDNNKSIINDKKMLFFDAVWVIYTWVIPNVIIVVVYYLTARALKANTLTHANDRAMEQINAQNAKIVKMFVIIIVLFFVLTIPYAVFNCYTHFQITYNFASLDIRFTTKVNAILFAIASANACVNPFIYANMHREINGFVTSVVRPIIGSLCGSTQNTIRDP